MALDNVWVLAEFGEAGPTSLTQELLTEARSIGSTVAAVAWGASTSEHAAALGEYGATKVYDVGDVGETLPGVPVAAAIAALVEGGDKPDALLVPASYDGRDVAGRLSVKLDRPVLTNVVGLSEDGGSSQHSLFGGTVSATARFTGEGPHIYVVRAKSFAAEPSGGGAAEVVSAPAPDTGATGAAKVTGRHVEERTGPKLDEASVIVSGGRGLGSADKYEMIEELAALLHGAAGASRAIVDAGWVPYARQVGQTGKTVKPNLYMACGISGATQHLVGMKGSKNIVAINKDQDAPIFSVADLGIVGDVHKVLPALIEALKSR
jgi:electron transfer flavoprotein alpha subunit